MEMSLLIKEECSENSLTLSKEICKCDGNEWVWVTITDAAGKCCSTKVSLKKLCCAMEHLDCCDKEGH